MHGPVLVAAPHLLRQIKQFDDMYTMALCISCCSDSWLIVPVLLFNDDDDIYMHVCVCVCVEGWVSVEGQSVCVTVSVCMSVWVGVGVCVHISVCTCIDLCVNKAMIFIMYVRPFSLWHVVFTPSLPIITFFMGLHHLCLTPTTK